MPKRKHHLTKGKLHSKIEGMANDVKPNVVTTQNPIPKRLLLTIIIAIILVALILTFKFGKFFPSAKPAQTPSTQKSKSVGNPHMLDTCFVTKADNPLVELLADSDQTFQGTFLGNISKLKKDAVLKSLFITLVSQDNKQTFTFNVAELPGLFINAQGQTKDSSILQIGQRARISFICDKKSRIFKYSRVAILPALATPSSSLKK